MNEQSHLDLVFKILTFFGGVGGTIASIYALITRIKAKAESMEHEVLKQRMRAIEAEQLSQRGQINAFISVSHQTAIEVARTAQAQSQLKETVDELKETVHELRGAVQELVVAVAGIK